MGAQKDTNLLENLLNDKKLVKQIKESPYNILIEILYEYLSQNISTHFEKTVEGLETLHESLTNRHNEHMEILRRLEALEIRMSRIEERLYTPPEPAAQHAEPLPTDDA